jgi:hypothetical protein
VDPRDTSIMCHLCGACCARSQQDIVICPVHGGMDADLNGRATSSPGPGWALAGPLDGLGKPTAIANGTVMPAFSRSKTTMSATAGQSGQRRESPRVPVPHDLTTSQHRRNGRPGRTSRGATRRGRGGRGSRGRRRRRAGSGR